jgi:hypothetical protein
MAWIQVISIEWQIEDDHGSEVQEQEITVVA